MEDLQDVKLTIAKNIRTFREKAGLTQKQLADKLGVKHNAISNWEKCVNAVDIGTLFKICKILGVSINDMYGAETPLTKDNLTSKQLALLNRYDSLDEHGKRIVDTILDYEYERCKLQKAHEEQAATSYIKETIPVYLAKAAAGIPLPIIADGYELIDKDDSVPAGADFGAILSGDSMEPDYPDGCTVWVKSQPTLENGDIGVFIIDGEATCKKYHIENGQCYLVSLNKKYKPIKINGESDIRIVGKVIGHN